MLNLTPFLGVFNTRTTDEDPLLSYPFRVDVDAFIRLGFMKASKLSMQFEEVKYREGGMNATVQKRPGLASFADVTFTRGVMLVSRGDLIGWAKSIFDVANKGPVLSPQYRRRLTYTVLDAEQNVAMTVNLKEAWPKEVTILGELDAMASSILVEEMVICHEGFEITT